MVIAFWMLTGFLVQVAMLSLSSVEYDGIILSGVNGFYEVAARHSAREFLQDFQTLSRDESFHVRANLAGKVLFYHVLRWVTDSPRGIAWLILLISNLGGLLTYAITTDLSRDRAAGLAALLLYLLLPAKLYFIPLLNTLSPVFILLPLWMLVRFCVTRRWSWLVGIGISLYWLVLFDPLPLVTGLVFLAVLARSCARGELGFGNLVQVFVLVPTAFCGTAALVSRAYGYDLIEAGRFAFSEAREFNQLNQRPYAVWLVQNLIDFLVNTGIATSALFLVLSVRAGLRTILIGAQSGWRAVLVSDIPITLSVLAVLVVLDGLGINRGEAIRLWIFLGVFITIPVAVYCSNRPLAFSLVISAVLLQTCTTLSTREFMHPW